MDAGKNKSGERLNEKVVLFPQEPDVMTRQVENALDCREAQQKQGAGRASVSFQMDRPCGRNQPLGTHSDIYAQSSYQQHCSYRI
jgi:hypothetical protein